jgi:dolichol-phosphate mannosyltransferase
MSPGVFKLSVVVPLYNEAAVLPKFHSTLVDVLQTHTYRYEIIYCNDGSQDSTNRIVQELARKDDHIKLISFTRNFGKENALTAGITHATGNAIIMLDGDGQHPPALIPSFVKAWEAGAKVVVGMRANHEGEGWLPRIGSWGFYKLLNKMSGQRLVRGATDFRLIDKVVQTEFIALPESNRITRGLIDWIGYPQTLVPFQAPERQDGKPGYSSKSLVQLALNGFVSLSPTPLYVFGYIGIAITVASGVLGLSIIIEQILLRDPFGWRFTGTAMLSILILFLVGIVLLSQGITALYVAHIHNQSKRRPLYIIDRAASVGVEDGSTAHK